MNKDKQNLLLIRNARVVLPETVRLASVLIENSHILRVIDSSTDESVVAQTELDLTGLTIFPGFVDLHIHGAMGVDMMEVTAADLGKVSKFLASCGVTHWLPTLVPGPQERYENAIQAIDEAMDQEVKTAGSWQRDELPGTSPGARVLGVHYEGPFVNISLCGALRAQYFKTFTNPCDLDSLPTLRAGVHMTTLAPEIEGGIALVRALRSRGWVVSLGHTRALIDILDEALAAGAHHMTHFMNAMAPLHHRSPGPVAWGLSRDDVTCDVIADGIHLDPYVLRLMLKLKGAERLSLISDAIAAAGMGDGEYNIWDQTIEVKDGRTRNAQGSIAGSVITMFDAVRLMLSLGASEVEVARMAATNPARLLRMEKECGSIEEGKRADLVAMDQEGNVKLTIIGGRIAYDADSSIKH